MHMAWPIACYRCGASAGWHGMHGRVFFCGKTVLCEFFVGFGKGKSVIVFNHSQVIAIFLGVFLNRPKMVGLLLGSHSIKSFFGVSLLIAVYVILYTYFM